MGSLTGSGFSKMSPVGEKATDGALIWRNLTAKKGMEILGSAIPISHINQYTVLPYNLATETIYDLDCVLRIQEHDILGTVCMSTYRNLYRQGARKFHSGDGL